MTERINITTPVGRLVYGDLYEPQTKDYEGKPLVGRDKVTPRVAYNFGVAIPKTQAHWANEPWGQAIWALAHKAFPNGETQRHDFAWKIIDGDSTIPNRRNRKPVEQEGYPGHWVLRFSAGFPIRVFTADGQQEILEKGAVKCGYYVQVFGSISDNAPSASPGLYFNPTYVAFSAYGPEIVSGPDVSAAGFGGAPLPPGASLTPPAGSFNPATPAPAAYPGAPAPGYPAPPVAPAAAPGYPAPPAPAPTPAPVAVAPHPAILNVPGAPVPGNPPGAPAPIAGAPSFPGMAPAPSAGPAMTYPSSPAPVAPARQMTAAAGGFTYEQLVANGWDDAKLIANGMMLP